MGSHFYQSKIRYWVKIALYIIVILVVGSLFGVRVHNTLQKNNYSTETIFQNGDIRVSLHHPVKILSPKNDFSYPLTFSFYYTGDITSPHTYEISLQSPTLLFVDSKGAELTPRFQFTSVQTFFEQSVYARPYLSEDYSQKHPIFISVLVDGTLTTIQPKPVEIEVEPRWFSFFSLAASSLLEVSIASALISWAAGAIDVSLSARKEREAARKEQVTKIRESLNSLSSLSYLEQMDKVWKLENEVKNEHLDGEIGEEVKEIKRRFNEEEFFRALGEKLRQNNSPPFSVIERLYNCFYRSKQYIECISVLGGILNQSTNQENVLSDIKTLMRLWDEFDINAKDLIVGLLKNISTNLIAGIAGSDLSEKVFNGVNRRRLLRDTEVKTLFSQLFFLPPVGYDTKWLQLPNHPVNPKVIDWLKQHDLVVNPFGASCLKNFPIYPEGSLSPDQWDDFLPHLPQQAQCLTAEDTRVLAFLLRAECLPTKKVGAEGNETVDSRKQFFPVWVSFNQSSTIESPILTVARSAAQAWLDILCFSPDAMLDLVHAEQIALLELLCWASGSNNAVINLLKRDNFRGDNASACLMIKKIEEFKSEFSSAHLPQDPILISWLKVRPPDLNYTYLILPLDEFSLAAHVWWLEQFGSLIPTLFLNGIVTKAFYSSCVPVALPLSTIQLDWSDTRLKTSLNAQFEAAMDRKARYETGVSVDFRALFGSHPLIGYFESEEDTTDKLIAASHNSLACMLTLGNRLLETHCEQEVPTPYLSVAELETILSIV